MGNDGRLIREIVPETIERAPPSIETFARLLHRASELLARQRDPDGAKELLERALDISPEHVTARSLLAQCLVQLGQYENALILFESLELELPDSAGAKVNIGVVLLKLGRASAARVLLERAVELAPEHRRAWGYLGVALEQLGLIDDAERAFLAGHHAMAARRLRDRHAPQFDVTAVTEVTAESARTAMPRSLVRNRTVPPDPWAAVPFQRFTETLKPPDFLPETPIITAAPPPLVSQSPTTPPEVLTIDAVEAMPFESVMRPSIPSSRAKSVRVPTPNRPVVPLLDAALASLLIVPHEASVEVHHSGLVLVGLVEKSSGDGGFVVRLDTIHAIAGAVRREVVARRDSLAPEPFRSGATPFARFVGTGRVVLRPPRATKLLPLRMDADVAFLREDLVVAFDHALLRDLGRMQRKAGPPLSLVRFRGDGVIVLELEGPFLALDVRQQVVALRTKALIGWVGPLAPDDTDHALEDELEDDFITVSGEGTLLFRAPQSL